MKTRNTLKLALTSLFIVGTMVSCNPPTINERTETEKRDSLEALRKNKIRADETRFMSQFELDRMSIYFDSLDISDPNFNRKLHDAMERFENDMDSMNFRLRRDGYEIDDETNRRHDSLRMKSKELKAKAERWANKAGDNLDELGNEIKMSFNDFKESLKSHDNKKQVDDSDL